MADLDDNPAVAVRFTVSVSNVDLGVFTACDGLGLEVVMDQREEGGNHHFVHQLPVRITYSNVKLTRPVNRDSETVASWLATFGDTFRRSTATIVALDSGGDPVARWTLHEVIPVRWTGPSLSVDSNKVATETLELAHHGFINA